MRKTDRYRHFSTSLFAFNDLLWSLLACFMLVTVLLITQIKAKAEQDAETESPGNLIVEIGWADKIDADVDLWVRAPGDVPVGYSNKAGRVFNLLRDDLGSTNDLTEWNQEIAYTRGLPAGDYTVNVHMYRMGAGLIFPLKVQVKVTEQPSKSGPAISLLSTVVELPRPNAEITAVRFKLDAEGHVVPGSINNVQKPLRSATQ